MAGCHSPSNAATSTSCSYSTKSSSTSMSCPLIARRFAKVRFGGLCSPPSSNIFEESTFCMKANVISAERSSMADSALSVLFSASVPAMMAPSRSEAAALALGTAFSKFSSTAGRRLEEASPRSLRRVSPARRARPAALRRVVMTVGNWLSPFKNCCNAAVSLCSTTVASPKASQATCWATETASPNLGLVNLKVSFEHVFSA
mmetsp:Transcript_21157/g.45883  ORF Transcript_21157/g.45883 Transcript_21157/m.45883 type:complete len:203 (-) Transcript_21157:399-1007(-)